SGVFDYGALTGVRPHYGYPQPELVAKRCDSLEAVGGAIGSRAMGTGLTQDDDGVTLSLVDGEGGPASLRCQVVAGCDGGRGAINGSLGGCEVADEVLPEDGLCG